MPDPTPTFNDAFASLFQEIRRGLQRQQDQLAFQATVVSFDTTLTPVNYATVIRLGATVEEGPYRVPAHITTLVAGDRVKVEDITGEGGFVIAYVLPLVPDDPGI